MGKYLKKWSIVLAVAVALIVLGVFLIIGGSLPGVVGMGSHGLNGAEKLMAIVPIAIGALLVWATIPPKN